MSDYQDLGYGERPGSVTDTGAGPGTGAAVDQIVFRWEGNQGRQGTGMMAVAHSCAAERAEELGRELGPLLWVSGPGAARPSVVRTLSRDGDVMLVQRWPTTDRAGRPSTVSHVLIGAPGTLKTRQCLGLAYGGWSTQASAEQAAGPLSVLAGAELDALARQRLPMMLDRLESVRRALILVAAQWLRDPAQRVSLLVEEETPAGWPDQDGTPLVYLGLFLLFGTWTGHEWTFATYDTVDTHPLRLTSVPRWEQDTGGSGPLARVEDRKVATPRLEHHAAAHLVRHLLAHPDADPGVPQLVEQLSGGATLDWARRGDLLGKILSADRRAGERTEPPAPAPAPRRPLREPERDRIGDRYRGAGSPPAQRPYEEATYQERPAPAPPYPEPPYPEAHLEPAPHPSPAPPPQHRTPDPAPSSYALHQDLCAYRRADHPEHRFLVAQLHDLSDDVLLRELRTGELPPDAVELLLTELGDHQRLRTRRRDMQHALCAHVLGNNLYLPPHGQGVESASRVALAARAADLFTWAVAPMARDDRYLHDLQELLARMSRDPHPTGGNWLWQSVISPANGQVPDLPPTVWQQILRDVLTRTDRPQPAAPPPPSSTPPEPLTTTARLSELSNNPGCVIGACAVVIAVLITIAVIVM